MYDDPFDPTLPLKCEWFFNEDPRAEREGSYTPESMAHPAKMMTHLARAITHHYTKPGETILEPMAGIGTNVIEPMKMGRNVVAIELERSHYGELKANVKLLLEGGSHGAAVALYCGNSKGLRDLITNGKGFSRGWKSKEKRPDAIITSPPFAEQNHRMGKVDERIGAKYPNDCHYSDNDQNMGNMKYGRIDAVITSPPFVSENRGGGAYKDAKGVAGDSTKGDYGRLGLGRVAQLLTDNPNNLDNIKRYGGDIPIQKRIDGSGQVVDTKTMKAEEKPTFLGELAAIMAECAAILKPGGVFIMHSKDSVKAGKKVAMGADIIRIGAALGLEHEPCPECGHGVAHTHRRRIPNPSFWINMRVPRWLAENINGYELIADITGRNDKTGAIEFKNQLWYGDKLMDGEGVRKAGEKHKCPYAGYWEDVIVMRKPL